MGMSRGGIGGGFGLVGVLLAAQIMPPLTAAAFLLPILVVTDPFAYWLYRKHVLWRSMNILLSGSLAGYSSFLIHSGLPPIAAYLLPQNITRQAFLGTVAVFFSICNFLKIVPYWYLGIFNFDLIGLTSLFIPISFVGLFVGRIINHFLTDRIFFIIVYITIFALGVRLIWTGV